MLLMSSYFRLLFRCVSVIATTKSLPTQSITECTKRCVFGLCLQNEQKHSFVYTLIPFLNLIMQSYTHFRQQRINNHTTCEGILEQFLNRIGERSSLNAFLLVNGEKAMESAKESDNRFNNGTQRLLEGMVVAVKDNISTKGIRTTCASKMLENFTPVYDATVVERLKHHGAIVIGKTNLDEFAMGSSNETSAFGAVGHPLDEQYVPGGSSGGSAVAVSAGLAHTALGSDTGGSVRQPAAFCGTVGYKPTYGLLSRYGLIAFASSLDQIGTFSHDIDDTALLIDAMSGHDSMDTTSAERSSTQVTTALHHHDEKITIGILPDELLEGTSPDVMAEYRKGLEIFETLNYDIITAEIPAKEAWIPTYYILTSAEASSNLSRFDGVRYGFRADLSSGEDMTTATRSQGFGLEVQRRILLGTYVLSSGYYDAYYKKGQQARQLITNGYNEVFAKCDCLYLPTTPTSAFKRGEKISDPVSMYLNDLFTVSANLAGIPAVSVPAGNSGSGFPIGMQLQAQRFEDEKLLRVARRLQTGFTA